MCTSVLSVYHVCQVPAEDRDPLELSFWIVVSHHMGARNQTWLLWEHSQ